MSKVHHTGIPCGCHKRWGSTVLTSLKNWAKVTCKNCLKTAA